MALLPFSHRHLVSAEQLSSSDIYSIFSRTEDYLSFLRSSERKRDDLKGVSVVLAFFENSTRTRISFEIAARRLSAEVISFQAASSSVGKGESLLDTVKTLEAMHFEILVMRHSQSGAPHVLLNRTRSSLINAGDGQHQHPTQGLLDAFTLYKCFGRLDGIKVCIVGDILHSRVARSTINILMTLGAQVGVCGPGTLLPHAVGHLDVQIFPDVKKVFQWADAVNILRIQHERMQQGLLPSLGEFSHFYGVSMSIVQQYPHVLIMHPGPMNRGVELEYEVADCPQSQVLSQVEHGVAVRMALLAMIAESRKASSHLSADREQKLS